ncbi:uncharacterized protein ISCGN_029623 [Ixodes scapularis]
MGKKCFVPRCKSGYDSCNEKVSLFSVPKTEDRLEVWRRAIGRKDRVLQATDCVCEKHFEAKFVSKFWEAVYKGHVLMSSPRKPCLASDAVPTKFPGCTNHSTSSNSSKNLKTRMRPGDRRRPPAATRRRVTKGYSKNSRALVKGKSFSDPSPACSVGNKNATASCAESETKLLEEVPGKAESGPNCPKVEVNSLRTVGFCELHLTSTAATLPDAVERHEAPSISACQGRHCEGTDGLTFSHGLVSTDLATTIVVKTEPMDVPASPTGKNMHIDDFSGIPTSLHMEGAMAKTCTVKKELDNVLGVPYSEGAYCLSSSRNHLEQGATSFIVIKKEPGEFAAIQADEGSCSGAFGSISSMQACMEGHWADAPLHMIEAPEEILPTPTGGSFRTKDCSRLPSSWPNSKGHRNGACALKEAEQLESAAQFGRLKARAWKTLVAGPH